ncbi:MAG: TIGR02186 family protein [Bauldia sp.]|nr:TIGR02186 family protein [Bauldia sp.]
MRSVGAGLLLLLASALPASAEQLIIALSTNNIRIDSGFTGDALTVFGVVERDAATVSRNSPYEIAVLVKGPIDTVVVRRKEPLLFFWVNRASETFTAAPSYYALNSTGPLEEIATRPLLQRLGLGFDNVPLQVSDAAEQATDSDFREAFIRLRSEAGLYSESDDGVDFIGTSDSVFRTAAWIPSNAPDGRYTIEVYLFSGEVFLARQQATLHVTKVGFEQFMFEASHNRALLYGLACVLLALFTGWLAGVVFRRD